MPLRDRVVTFRSHLDRYGSRLSAVAASRLVVLASAAAGTRVLTELVSPETFGEFKLIGGLALAAAATVFGPMKAYTMRTMHDYGSGRESPFLAAMRQRNTLAACGITSTTVLVAGLWATGQGDPQLIFASIAAAMLTIGVALAGFESGVLVSKGRVGVAAMYEASSAVLAPVAAAAVVLLFAQSSSLMAGAQAVIFVLLAWALRAVDGSSSVPDRVRVDTAALLRFSLPLASVGALAWLFNTGDRYLLAVLTDTGDVGTYAAAYGLAAAPLAAAGSLLPTLAYAPLYRSAARGTEGQRRSISTALAVYQGSLVAAVGIAAIVLAPVAVRLLLAPEYRENAVTIVRLVAVGQGLQVAAYAFDLDALSRIRTGILATAYGTAVVVAVGAMLVTVPRYGTIGAALATALSGCAYFFVTGASVVIANRRMPT